MKVSPEVDGDGRYQRLKSKKSHVVNAEGTIVTESNQPSQAAPVPIKNSSTPDTACFPGSINLAMDATTTPEIDSLSKGNSKIVPTPP